MNDNLFMKTCTKCQIEKPETDYYQSRGRVENTCKTCRSEKRKLIYPLRRGKWNIKAKEYREANRDKKKQYCKEYRVAHKKEISIKQKRYCDERREDIRRLNRESRYRHIEKRRAANSAYAKRPDVAEKRREYIRNYDKQHWETDPNYKLVRILRARIRTALQGKQKSESTAELLGCSIEKLRKHLEKQFLSGMTWQNHKYDGWHVDHIIPCYAFDLSFPNQQKECFNYKNLRPLWAHDNMSKGAKLDHPFQPSLAM